MRTQRIRGYRRRKVLPWFFVAKLSLGPQRARPFPGDLSSRGGPGWPQARELLDPKGNSPITALTPNCQNCQGARGPQGVAGATGRPLPTEPAQGFGFRSCRSCGPSSLLRRAPGGSRPRPTCVCPCYPRGSPERTLPCPAAVGTWERTSSRRFSARLSIFQMKLRYIFTSLFFGKS